MPTDWYQPGEGPRREICTIAMPQMVIYKYN